MRASFLLAFLLSLCSAAPTPFDAKHKHDGNNTRNDKIFENSEIHMGDLTVDTATGDNMQIGHTFDINVVQSHGVQSVKENADDSHGNAALTHSHDGDFEERLSRLFKSMDTDDDGIISVTELIRICNENDIYITELEAENVLTYPSETVPFTLSYFLAILENAASSSDTGDLIDFLLRSAGSQDHLMFDKNLMHVFLAMDADHDCRIFVPDVLTVFQDMGKPVSLDEAKSLLSGYHGHNHHDGVDFNLWKKLILGEVFKRHEHLADYWRDAFIHVKENFDVELTNDDVMRTDVKNAANTAVKTLKHGIEFGECYQGELVKVEGATVEVKEGLLYKLQLRISTMGGEDCMESREMICENILIKKPLPKECRGTDALKLLKREHITCELVVDGVWSEWNNFGACSATCGDGIQKRERTCILPTNGGKPCNGPTEEQQDCYLEDCASISECLTSPGYPENYPNYARTRQTLSVEDGKGIEITFDDFELEAPHTLCGPGYCCDFIEFQDENSNTIREIKCGSSVPEKFTIPAATAYAVFESDESENFRGYKFCYRSVDLTDIERDSDGAWSTTVAPSATTVAPSSTTSAYDSCNNLIEKMATYSPDFIESQNFGTGSYPPNKMDCWRIIWPQGKQLSLSFDPLFRLEGDTGCPYDYLHMYSANSLQFYNQKFCGVIAPTDLVVNSNTHSNALLVKFATDEDNLNGCEGTCYGFRMNFVTVDDPLWRETTVAPPETTDAYPEPTNAASLPGSTTAYPTNAAPTTAAYPLYSKDWSEVTEKHWSGAECPNLSVDTTSLEECKKNCEDLKTCTAINYVPSTSKCVLKACPAPMPAPQTYDAEYKGYFLLEYLVPPPGVRLNVEELEQWAQSQR